MQQRAVDEWNRCLTGRMDFDAEAFKQRFLYGGDDLGAVYTKEKTCFQVWAPTAERVQLNLYRTGYDGEEGAEFLGVKELLKKEKGVWGTEADGDLENLYYTYTVTVEGKPRETADVYAKACGVNGNRSMVVDLRHTDPENFRQDTSYLDVRKKNAECPVIYELHIKDFSNSIHSGVCEAYRGKYLAFTEEHTTLDGRGAAETGVAYLKKLGITHVHLLPFFDFASVDECGDLRRQFNWGYDPANYNVPEGSYSTDPYHGEVRIRECKQMIQSLHKAGISVIMDVVYNHTFSLDSAFQRTVPDYYYRKYDKGIYANGSLCGNDTASEREMFRKYIIDSVCYWAQEYHLDGFRFDLMGLHDVETMNQIREALDGLPGGRDILMYGEPWSGDYSPMREGEIAAAKENVSYLNDRIAVFCDNTRDAIKGSVFVAEEAGFVNGEAGLESEICESVGAWCRKQNAGFTPTQPRQVISYVSAHDNYTLWDKLMYTLPSHDGKKRNEINFEEMDRTVLRQNKMAAGIYFTCLGIPFFQAGEEFARTKQGLGNTYNASARINELSWERCTEFADLLEYYRGLIAFRRKRPGIYGRNATGVHIRFERVKMAGVVAFSIKSSGREKKESLFVIYNAKNEKVILTLPDGKWNIISDGNRIYPEDSERGEVSRTIIANQLGVMILEKA